jgi:hypothetical protein
MPQKEDFAAPNKRTPYIKQKKKKKCTKTILQPNALDFQLKEEIKVEIKERKIKEERKKKTMGVDPRCRPTAGLGLASH